MSPSITIPLTRYTCDECGTGDLPADEMGKFCGRNEGDGHCGVCIRCLRKMGVIVGGTMPRGTNRTPPKKRRKKR